MSSENQELLGKIEKNLGEATTESFRKVEAIGYWSSELEICGIFYFRLKISREQSNF